MDEPIQLPIDGVLDLHTFRPREIKDLVLDYLAACRERGIFQVRIIHGKGSSDESICKKALIALISFDDFRGEVLPILTAYSHHQNVNIAKCAKGLLERNK